MSICRTPLRYGTLNPRTLCTHRLGFLGGVVLYLVINDQGEILAFALIPDNVDNRQPVPKLVRRLMGKLIEDKGYLLQP